MMQKIFAFAGFDAMFFFWNALVSLTFNFMKELGLRLLKKAS
jgi:hypothetical protein